MTYEEIVQALLLRLPQAIERCKEVPADRNNYAEGNIFMATVVLDFIKNNIDKPSPVTVPEPQPAVH